MKPIRLVLAIALSLGVAAPTARADPPAGEQAEEATLDALLSAIRSNRRAVVAVNLELSNDEAAKFWPIYERYQKEMNTIGDRQVAVIQDYAASFPNIPNDKAMKLVEDYLAVDGDRVRVRREYVDDFAGSLPGRKVARFYQIENKMDAVIRYELAARIPVVDVGAAPPK